MSNKDPFAGITLDFPVRLADRDLTELTMRRPSLDDEIRYVPASREPRKQLEEEARYFAHLCGLPAEELRKLDMGDYEKLQRQYLFFRGRGEPPRNDTPQGTAPDSGNPEPSGADAA